MVADECRTSKKKLHDVHNAGCNNLNDLGVKHRMTEAIANQNRKRKREHFFLRPP